MTTSQNIQEISVKLHTGREVVLTVQDIILLVNMRQEVVIRGRDTLPIDIFDLGFEMGRLGIDRGYVAFTHS